MEHDVLVAQQFGATARAYLESVTHATGEDLEILGAEIAAVPDAVVLDLGCGAGHASFAIASHAASVTAYDLTAQMLAVVQREAAARKLRNITTVQGMAEVLPFPDAHFDRVISRYSAHHWHDVPAALHEVRRVLKPRGEALLIDTAGGENPLLDTHLQAIEILRDPSHIRDYSTREWLALFAEAGFTASVRKEWPVKIEFSAWVERQRTSPERIAAIHALWGAAPDEVRSFFEVQPDSSFTLQKVLIAARR
ncbi:MAG TPA: class I SAM-dependent methyltransferase [Acidobacteriaceae bacterium]|nr:class I SAM-dependent methyltransferase [Acidobacteriaceae bacterium]